MTTPSRGQAEREAHHALVAKEINGACPGFAAETPLGNGDYTGMTLKEHLIQADDVTNVNKALITELALLLARLHKATQRTKMDPTKFTQLCTTVSSKPALEGTLHSLFVRPYMHHVPVNHDAEEVLAHAYRLYKNQTIVDAVASLRRKLQSKQECLIHGHLDTEAVGLVGGKPQLVRCDWGVIGPGSFDLGILLAHYMLSYYQHMLTPDDNDRHRSVSYAMVETCTDTVLKYIGEFKDLYPRDEDFASFEEELSSEVAGYVGCELIRSVIGIPRPKEFLIRPEAQQEVLQAGIRLITAFHRISSVHQLVNIAFMLT